MESWRRLRRSRAVSHCTKRRPLRLEKSFPSHSKTTTTEESRRRRDVLSLYENLSYRALRPSSILHQLHTDFPLARGFVYFCFYSTGNPLDDSISTLPENGRLRNTELSLGASLCQTTSLVVFRSLIHRIPKREKWFDTSPFRLAVSDHIREPHCADPPCITVTH